MCLPGVNRMVKTNKGENTTQYPISTLGRVDGYKAVGVVGNDLDDYYVKLFTKLFKIIKRK